MGKTACEKWEKESRNGVLQEKYSPKIDLIDNKLIRIEEKILKIILSILKKGVSLQPQNVKNVSCLKE